MSKLMNTPPIKDKLHFVWQKFTFLRYYVYGENFPRYHPIGHK